MKANVGSLDRILRITLGLVILGTGFYFKTWWGLIGIGPILTGTFRFCPAYPLIGLSTCASGGVNITKVGRFENHDVFLRKPIVDERAAR